MMEGVGGVSQTPWNMLTGTCTFLTMVTPYGRIGLKQGGLKSAWGLKLPHIH